MLARHNFPFNRHCIHCVFDYATDSAVAQKLIVEFYEAGKPTAAVCHGPIVFKNVKLTDGSVLVAGKEVTGFTNAEEEAVGKTEVVAEPSGPGSCEDVLTAARATFKDGGVRSHLLERVHKCKVTDFGCAYAGVPSQRVHCGGTHYWPESTICQANRRSCCGSNEGILCLIGIAVEDM